GRSGRWRWRATAAGAGRSGGSAGRPGGGAGPAASAGPAPAPPLPVATDAGCVAALLHGYRLGRVRAQREGAGLRLVAPAAARTGPDRIPGVRHPKRNARPGGKGRRTGGTDGYAQTRRRRGDGLAVAAGGREGELRELWRGRGRHGATADVDDASATARLRCRARAADERATAPVGNGAAVLSLGAARRRRTGERLADEQGLADAA